MHHVDVQLLFLSFTAMDHQMGIVHVQVCIFYVIKVLCTSDSAAKSHHKGRKMRLRLYAAFSQFSSASSVGGRRQAPAPTLGDHLRTHCVSSRLAAAMP